MKLVLKYNQYPSMMVVSETLVVLMVFEIITTIKRIQPVDHRVLQLYLVFSDFYTNKKNHEFN